ncbi:MAG: restriction endonuclease subunit S [Abitibacteriaceae bacterium]|nr:restriction endonuclease subunit S [Abditibacteriaceae bacterium]
MRRGDIEKRLDHYYHKPEFEIEANRIAASPYPKKELGELCFQITDGTHFTPAYVDAGIPFISVKDVREFEISFEETKFVSEEEHKTLTLRCNPQPGDILLTKVGTIGLAAVIPPTAPTFDLFVSVCLLKIDTSQALPEFLCAVFNTHIARTQFTRHLKGIGVPDLHLENIRECQISLPPLDTQRELVAQLDAARAQRAKRLADADALLTGLDDFLLDELKLTVPQTPARLTYAVKAKNAVTRFDPSYHSPHFKSLRAVIDACGHPVLTVSQIVIAMRTGFAAGREAQADNGEQGVLQARPMNITPNGEFSLQKSKYVPAGSFSESEVLQKNELLFNNTNSTMWVGKSAVFDSEVQCVCSNHITRIQVRSELVNSFYLAALFNTLRAQGLFGLLATNFNNQAGVNIETLGQLRVPVPSLETQKRIAKEVQSRRERARILRAEAERDWDAAKAKFEAALLGQ